MTDTISDLTTAVKAYTAWANRQLQLAGYVGKLFYRSVLYGENPARISVRKYLYAMQKKKILRKKLGLLRRKYYQTVRYRYYQAVPLSELGRCEVTQNDYDYVTQFRFPFASSRLPERMLDGSVPTRVGYQKQLAFVYMLRNGPKLTGSVFDMV